MCSRIAKLALVAAFVSMLSGCWLFMPPAGGHGGGEGGGHGGPGGGPDPYSAPR